MQTPEEIAAALREIRHEIAQLQQKKIKTQLKIHDKWDEYKQIRSMLPKALAATGDVAKVRRYERANVYEGKCLNCPELVEPGKHLCAKHLELLNKRQRSFQAKVKEKKQNGTRN